MPDWWRRGIRIQICATAAWAPPISFGALTKWPLWGLDFQKASLRADGFDREVYLRAPDESKSKDDRSLWRLRALAYGINDAPVALHQSLSKFWVNSSKSASGAGLRSEVSLFGPRFFGASAGWGSCAGLPRFLGQISVRGWRGVPQRSMRPAGVMSFVLTNWRRCPSTHRPSAHGIHLGIATSRRMTCVIGERMCIAVRFLWLDGRVLFLVSSRRKESAGWVLRVA